MDGTARQKTKEIENVAALQHKYPALQTAAKYTVSMPLESVDNKKLQ